MHCVTASCADPFGNAAPVATRLLARKLRNCGPLTCSIIEGFERVTGLVTAYCFVLRASEVLNLRRTDTKPVIRIGACGQRAGVQVQVRNKQIQTYTACHHEYDTLGRESDDLSITVMTNAIAPFAPKRIDVHWPKRAFIGIVVRQLAGTDCSPLPRMRSAAP